MTFASWKSRHQRWQRYWFCSQYLLQFPKSIPVPLIIHVRPPDTWDLQELVRKVNASPISKQLVYYNHGRNFYDFLWGHKKYFLKGFYSRFYFSWHEVARQDEFIVDCNRDSDCGSDSCCKCISRSTGNGGGSRSCNYGNLNP